MKHLSDAELVDALDGQLSSERVEHLRECTGCAGRVAEMRLAFSYAEVDVPEPSPLFWDHLSARIRAQIQEQPSLARSKWLAVFRPWPAALAGIAAAAILLATSSPVRRPAPALLAPTTEATKASNRDASSVSDHIAADDIEGDEAWALVRVVADDVVWEDVNEAGISARPGSVERAMLALTEAERIELAALLREELKRAGA